MTAAPAAAPSPKFTDFAAILDEIIAGRLPIPNYKPLDLSHGVGSIAAGSGLDVTEARWGAHVEGADQGRGSFARFFLRKTQGGAFDGSGLVMMMTGSGGTIGSFAICEHEIVALPGGNPRRGWSPSRCRLCNLNTSIDSGD